MIDVNPVYSENIYNRIDINPCDKKDKTRTIEEINRINEEKEDYLRNIKYMLRNLEVSKKLPKMRKEYSRLRNNKEMSPIELKIITEYEKFLTGERYLGNEIEKHSSKVNSVKVELEEQRDDVLYLKINENENVRFKKKGKWNVLSEGFRTKENCVSEIDFEKFDSFYINRFKPKQKEIVSKATGENINEFEFSVSKEKKPLKKCHNSVKNAHSKNIIKEINRIKKSKDKVDIIKIADSFKSNSFILPIIKLIENIEEKQLVKYDINTPEITDALIERFNLEYISIPQEKCLLLSNNKDLEEYFFDDKFPKKQSIKQEEWSKILREINVPENRIKSYKQNDRNIHKMKEYEKLADMKRKNKIDNKDIRNYRYSMKMSDGSKKDLKRLIREGQNVREKILDRNYKEIVKNIDKLRIFNFNSKPRYFLRSI